MKTPPEFSFNDTAIAFSYKSDGELSRSRWLFRLMSKPTLVDIGSQLTKLALKLRLPVRVLVKKTIYQHFCGGESLQQTLPTIKLLAESGVSTILDYGVEAKESEPEFDRAVDEQIRAIAFANGNPSVPYISCKFTGYAPLTLLSALHEGTPLTPPQTQAYVRLRNRLTRICDAASESDVAVYVDAEESWIQDGIDTIVNELMQKYNTDKPVVFNTIQLYRHDRLEFFKRAHRQAKRDGHILGVKLVRGAYMEKERARAQEMGLVSPIHTNKTAVDEDYDEAILYSLKHIDEIAFCAATHNEKSCLKLVRAAKKSGVNTNHPHIHFAQLLGMSDHISFNLAQWGYNASKYVPYGPVQDVVPYLIRRAKENRSVAGQMSRELRLLESESTRRRQTRRLKN